MIYSIFAQEIKINNYKEFTNEVLHSECIRAIEHFNKVVIENNGRISVWDKEMISRTLGECQYSSLKNEVVINAAKNTTNNPYF